MRLTRQQLYVVQVLQNGGYIWFAAGHPYLAHSENGRIKSVSLNIRTFDALMCQKVIIAKDHNQWRLA